MERKYHKKIPRSKKERIGLSTGLLDCNGNEILTGDTVHLIGTNYTGPVMWNRNQNAYGIFMGLWPSFQNPFDPDCYGKFIPIPADNGMRMQLKQLARSTKKRCKLWIE